MRKILTPILLIAILVIYSSLVVVNEGSRGIMLRFGKVHRDVENKVVVYEPGLHFKIPFIDSMKVLDARIRTLDGAPDRFVTVEKKDLLVDSYVKWRISDFGRFFTATGGGDYTQASNLLRRKVNDRLRSEVGSRTIKDIVSGTRGELMVGARKALNTGQDSTSELGIEVVDVRVKQINLPDEVSSSIYQRMRAERDAVAREHRSQGKEKAAFIQADVDRKVTVILATANKTAQELRGNGDAAAAKLYTDAFSQEPEFYSFIRSLKAYEKSFAESNNMLILKPDSDFFRFMKSSSK
ncbi:protease modulator HflC [Avibacterium paragallinarum]|uniref:Protein HflC n=1 Tax=Avibacterium paragallinarum TaxID=728 RepID=A0A2S5AU04_AVIPA|nr:protease modulator HflC [Avibacterium paragallinarum]MEE3607649.1 protease modulator HflC [Avibacterium paragallinarum]MEE3619975.1 protease modulator HflC [Avibacterium paragallinarum]MEE3667659.1 protease modulator HflC [Avibacterium paragallinarum]MEE3679887.1 protease modulator HflC [Avibacterium paragallinarum]MEE4384792.1 protease modulator HflC [Avibacterium paragallinarum]